MIVSLDAEAFEFLAIEVGAGLAVVVGDDDRTDQETTLLKLRAQAEDIFIVGNAEVAAHLVLLNVNGTDDDDYFGAVAQLRKHFQFTVGLKTRQNSAGVVVVEEFAS